MFATIRNAATVCRRERRVCGLTSLLGGLELHVDPGDRGPMRAELRKANIGIKPTKER